MAGTNNLSSVRTNVKIDNSTVLIPHGEAEYKVDKLFFSAVKEEEWLNLLASRGYALVGRKFTGYIFAVDKVAAKYYYSVCLLPAPAEAEYSEHYMAEKLKDAYGIVYTGVNGRVGHELILDCRQFHSIGITESDIAKRLMDFGYHAPTLSFPVHGTLMVEPTESESLHELDQFVDALLNQRLRLFQHHS